MDDLKIKDIVKTEKGLEACIQSNALLDDTCINLEEIGFYTLNNKRAMSSSVSSLLYRCELLLTDRCNFKCHYCRGLKSKGDLKLDDAERIMRYWISEGLKNVRFSGGEPTLYPHLGRLVKMAADNNVEHIAISTNGSAELNSYKELIDCGVNDFSISLDACCSSSANVMSGVYCSYETILYNIEELSKLTYVTVGIVVNDKNINECEDTIKLAYELGVGDIRVIPSAQYDLKLFLNLSDEIISSNSILRYRINNWKAGKHVRGISRQDHNRCKIVVDDMAVLNGEHYPCIIYLREQGEAIGQLNDNTRQQRWDWYKTHDTHKDQICKQNCLDVCVDFNNRSVI